MSSRISYWIQTYKARRKMKCKLNKFLRMFFSGCLLLLLIYTTISIVAPKKIIGIFRYQYFVIISPSMSPVLNRGDLVIVKAIKDINDLQKDQIITFYQDVNQNGKPDVVTHYFYSVEINDQGKKVYRTRPAGSDEKDSWELNEDDIIGQYVTHISKIGKIVLFIKSPVGILLVVFYAAVLYIINKSTKKPKEIEDLSDVY